MVAFKNSREKIIADRKIIAAGDLFLVKLASGLIKLAGGRIPHPVAPQRDSTLCADELFPLLIAPDEVGVDVLGALYAVNLTQLHSSLVVGTDIRVSGQRTTGQSAKLNKVSDSLRHRH